jgi:signal transduction histidine kinase
MQTILEESVSEVRSRFPDATVDLQAADQAPTVNGILNSVLLNAIENAAEHNDSDNPHVKIVASVDERITIEIRDDGPGISEYELSVLSGGTESALHHGSGLGLWIIKWGTDLLGGSVRFSENKASGTVVTISLPWEGG